MRHEVAAGAADHLGCLAGGGEVGALLRARDWAESPLGPVDGWPESLRTAARMALASRAPMLVFWGDALTTLYNDACIPMLGARHPDALAAPAAQWWDALGGEAAFGASARDALKEGKTIALEGVHVLYAEGPVVRSATFGFTFGPLFAGDGQPAGVFCSASEEMPRSSSVPPALLARIIEAVPVLISYVDTEHCYRLVNRGYQRWFGHAPETMVGKHVREVVGDAAYEAVRPYMERVLAGEAVSYDQKMPYRSGGARTVHVDYVPDKDADGRVNGVVALVSDITSRHAAEEALRESERRVSEILHSIDDVFLAVDRSWRITHASRAVVEVSGMREEALIGTNLWESFPWAIGAPIEAAYRKAMDERVSVHLETQGMRSKRWLDTSIYPTVEGISIFARDVSARKEAENVVREAREELQLVVDTMPVYVARCSKDRRFLLANKGYAARLGLTPEQLSGKPVREILGEAAYATLAPHIDTVLTGQPVNFETEVTHALGRHFFHIQYAPTFDAAGAPDGWVAAVSDITRRRELEEALKEANRRKDEFLAMLAHELRNPLAPVLHAVELIRHGRASDPRRGAEVIARQMLHMKRLLDDLLDVARVSQGKIQLRKEPLDLSAVLGQAVEVSRPLIDGKKHELAIALPERPLPIEGDPTRLTQIFANLLNNAAKYTDKGGHIGLEATVEGGSAVVRVRDDGVGMSAEMLEHAFDLFTQADRSLDRAQGGLGIGLTLVKSLVQMHGGSVQATSEGQGRGTEMIVRLPLSSPPEEPAIAAPASAEAPRTLRALVVDDNVDAADSLALLLEMLGHEVGSAHDGPDALAKALASKPDIILLDIGLPGMDGYEVAARLREEGLGSTVLVALTGYGREEDMARSREAGFDHHLVKPVDIATLQKVIASVAASRPE
ncbi:PAS domain-containing protein [Polyangium aurulentum]|uniref:PAS domain-containing protein n=1 Tax=Polyangium aurulentum TaxID=2567896 RepID=UPI00146E54F5|nr:PAS domain-containing protein [Polyangium aurulentum]UQA59099.1 PAS domain-containing protein [Polyangium aurulentum]